MHRLRNHLIATFFAATALPLAATFWITTSLLDRSLGYATTDEIDRLSRTLEATVRQFYQRERDALKQEALAGRATPVRYPVTAAGDWPEAVRAFWDSGELERFGISGSGGDHVDYLRRSDGSDDGAAGWSYEIDYGDGTSRSLGAITAATTDVHYYEDDGVFQVTVQATDVDGATATASASVAVVPFSFSVAASPTSVRRS